jgi:segregation and condensation protein A
MTEAAALEAPTTVAPDVTSWEDPPRSASSASAPVLSVEGFEGPLDWLLEMARARKIDLARLPIAALIESFADALETTLARTDARASPLERWGAWLVMAATLTHLRSRLLLPAAPDAQQATAQAEGLRRQLMARARIREAAHWLERRPQLGREVFPRGRPEAAAGPARVADIADLLRACLVLLQLPDDQGAAYQPRPPPFWRVPEAIAHIERLISVLPDGSALGAFLPRIDDAAPGGALRRRAALASTLVAGLELARAGAVSLQQDGPWRPVLVGHAEGQSTRAASEQASGDMARSTAPVPPGRA